MLAGITGSALADEKVMGKPMTGAPDPDAVLKILETAVQNRSREDYRDALADSFVYVTDLTNEAMYPSIDWNNWGINEEVDFLDRLLSPVLSAELRLIENIDERGMPADHRAHYRITYQLIIEGHIYTAEATFDFVETDNRWYLWKWEEIMPVNVPSGGGVFSNSGEARASLAP